MVTAGVIEVESVILAVRAILRDDPVIRDTLAFNGRVYRDVAPEKGLFPVITVSNFNATDTNSLGEVHIQQVCQILVKVTEQFTGVALNYNLKLLPAAKQIHKLLDGYSGVVDDVYIVKMRRTSVPPQPPTPEGGVRYAYVNQVFQTEAWPHAS